MKQKVFDVLDFLLVEYQNFEHVPVFTCDEAKWVDIPWLRVKSLLLRNKKWTNYYMAVLEDKKMLDTNIIREYFQDTKLSFVSEEKMIELIWIKPWSVSPYALVNNSEKNIKIIFDEDLKNEIIGLHPLQNDNTVVTWMDNILKFLEHLEFEYFFTKLENDN